MVKLNKYKKLSWFDLWVDKSDYVTDFYRSIKGKYSIIDESIDYYMAMLEIGIVYLKDLINYYDYVYVQYDVFFDGKYSMKEDIKERNLAEYLKYLFYNDYDIECVYNLIEREKNNINYYLVGVRLLFPSYYFYYFEKIILENDGYNELSKVIEYSYEYEKYLKQVIAKINEYSTKKIILPF